MLLVRDLDLLQTVVPVVEEIDNPRQDECGENRYDGKPGGIHG